jgi:hypothetical protein
MRNRHALTPSLALLIATGAVASAEDFQIHGYVSQGYFVTTHNDFLSKNSENTGTFDATEMGLNVTATPADRLRVGIQVSASDSGEYGDLRPQIDWGYGEYEIPELVQDLTLSVTAGRFKAEYGFYNEYRDLDMTRSTVFLPFTVYDPRFRDAFIALNGAQVKAGLNLHAGGSLDFSARVGNPTWDSENGNLATYFRLLGVEPTDISSEVAFGGTLTWNTPVDGLRARFSYLHCEDLEVENDLPGGAGTYDILIPHYRSGVVGLEWQVGDFTFVGEAKQTYFKSLERTVVPAFFLDVTDAEYSREEGAYLSGAWRFHEQWEGVLGGQWGLSDPIDYDAPVLGGAAPRRQHHRGINLALRWDVTDHWLIKAEAQWMDGRLLITSGEQKDTEGIQDNWTLYSIKTTYDF